MAIISVNGPSLWEQRPTGPYPSRGDETGRLSINACPLPECSRTLLATPEMFHSQPTYTHAHTHVLRLSGTGASPMGIAVPISDSLVSPRRQVPSKSGLNRRQRFYRDGVSCFVCTAFSHSIDVLLLQWWYFKPCSNVSSRRRNETLV
jgi:hypothetical protein